jgi:hypothetical protein
MITTATNTELMAVKNNLFNGMSTAKNNMAIVSASINPVNAILFEVLNIPPS